MATTDWFKRPLSAHAQQDQELSARIVAHFEANRHVYGTRRLKDCLADEGQRVSRRRIGRLMTEQGASGSNEAQIQGHDRFQSRPSRGAQCVGPTIQRR